MKTMKFEEKFLLRALLPDTLKISMHKAEEGGYWAKVTDIPCLSQGETLSELFNVLTMSIYAYYDIPEKFISEFGSYYPVSSVREQFSEQKSEKNNTLDDILQDHSETIHELQRISL